jgi:hypothetical protein
MTTVTLERIEADIQHLSLADQLWLMERLAHHIRENSVQPPSTWEAQLEAMAQDPEIQRELHEIETEFAGTEMDGLEVLE